MRDEQAALGQALGARGDLSFPSDALLALLALRRAGLAESARRQLPWLAKHCAIELAPMRELLRFEEALVASLRTGNQQAAVCEGTWCRLSGGEAWRAKLETLLKELDLGSQVGRYHCLAHCQEGPNMVLGAHVHCCGEGAVHWDVPDRHRESWIPVEG